MSQPTIISHPADREVSTRPEEWRHERKVAAVLAMSPAQQRAFLEGATDPAAERKERWVVEIRGAASVEPIKTDMVRLGDIRRAARN